MLMKGCHVFVAQLLAETESQKEWYGIMTLGLALWAVILTIVLFIICIVLCIDRRANNSIQGESFY